jgi:hypothetical protein
MKKLAVTICALLLAMPFASFAQAEQKSAAPLGEQKSPSPLGEGRGEGRSTKKPAPKKPAAPKKPSAPKKPVAKAPPAGPPNVTVYKSSQQMPPTLRDNQGNLIPTSPDAYDVSSAKRAR